MTIHAKLTAEDYLKANYLVRRFIPLIFLFFWIAGGLVVADFFTSPPDDRVWGVLLIALAFIAYPLWVIWIISRRARRIFRQQKILHDTYEMEITADGLISVGSYATFKMSWSDFLKYKCGKNFILVYHSDVAFHMFPRSWFTDEQFAEFQSYLKDALGKSK